MAYCRTNGWLPYLGWKYVTAVTGETGAQSGSHCGKEGKNLSVCSALIAMASMAYLHSWQCIPLQFKTQQVLQRFRNIDDGPWQELDKPSNLRVYRRFFEPLAHVNGNGR
jgi:hypothetical protein